MFDRCCTALLLTYALVSNSSSTTALWTTVYRSVLPVRGTLHVRMPQEHRPDASLLLC